MKKGRDMDKSSCKIRWDLVYFGWYYNGVYNKCCENGEEKVVDLYDKMCF